MSTLEEILQSAIAQYLNATKEPDYDPEPSYTWGLQAIRESQPEGKPISIWQLYYVLIQEAREANDMNDYSWFVCLTHDIVDMPDSITNTTRKQRVHAIHKVREAYKMHVLPW